MKTLFHSLPGTFAALALLLAAPAVAREPAAQPQKIPVALSASLEGAPFTIDGTQSGQAPATVWLEPGPHIIRFAPEGSPATFAEFTVDPAANNELNVKLPAPSAPVLLLSRPAGATVQRNGITLGVTPLLLPEEAPGRHTFSFRLNGYRDQQSELQLTAGTPAQLDVALVSSTAAVSVTSEPTGASVSVNGFPRGTTPVTLSDIPEGEASIEISAPGYRKFTSQMRVAAGDTLALHAPLEALPSSLTVVTIPAGARVYVDNVFKGNSPLELQEIAAGEYRVRVDMAGYDSMARNVTVKIDQQVTEEFKLAANIGSIRVSTAPAGVTILIDGKAAGKTVAADESSDTVSEPLLIPDVLQGPHTITFTRPGYGESVKSIEITRNQELSLGTVTLERKFIPDVIVHTRKDVYRGVYIEKTAEFYRIETSPGLIRSIPQRDITRVELIRTDAQAPAPETRR